MAGLEPAIHSASPAARCKHRIGLEVDGGPLALQVAVALACRLFADRVVSLAKAARLAGLPVEDFIQRLGAMGIPAVDYPPDEIERELATLGR